MSKSIQKPIEKTLEQKLADKKESLEWTINYKKKTLDHTRKEAIYSARKALVNLKEDIERQLREIDNIENSTRSNDIDSLVTGITHKMLEATNNMTGNLNNASRKLMEYKIDQAEISLYEEIKDMQDQENELKKGVN